MGKKRHYRLSAQQKVDIAQNLIDFLQKDTELTDDAIRFIQKWVLTGPEGKTKAFFDVWDIVLRNYMPTTRPLLFRACDRIGGDGKIASFTGQLECARRFSKGRGSLIMCDTEKMLLYEEQLSRPGEYQNTFYPLGSILEKANASGTCGFSDSILEDFIGEDEYIMRVDLDSMYCFKWTHHGYFENMIWGDI
jgi:hypothetical protein